MNEADYFKKAYVLADELERAILAKPYDPKVHHDVVDRLQALHSSKLQRRRRRPWAALASCIILLMVLLYIVYSILCFLLILDSQ